MVCGVEELGGLGMEGWVVPILLFDIGIDNRL